MGGHIMACAKPFIAQRTHMSGIEAAANGNRKFISVEVISPVSIKFSGLILPLIR